MYKIAPSILSADLAKLGEEVTEVILAGADWIHFDVMDNHYVPNLTFGPLICKALKPYTKNTPIDVHLMVEPVDQLITDFANAGADLISFHPEASKHIHRSLQLIKSFNLKAGLVLNPATPVLLLHDLLPELDYILLMSVNPGFGGQIFISHTLSKIKETRILCDNYAKETGKTIEIEIDGGVNVTNIKQIAEAGANIFVAGSAIFNQADRKTAITNLKEQLIISRE